MEGAGQGLQKNLDAFEASKAHSSRKPQYLEIGCGWSGSHGGLKDRDEAMDFDDPRDSSDRKGESHGRSSQGEMGERCTNQGHLEDTKVAAEEQLLECQHNASRSPRRIRRRPPIVHRTTSPVYNLDRPKIQATQHDQASAAHLLFISSFHAGLLMSWRVLLPGRPRQHNFGVAPHPEPSNQCRCCRRRPALPR